MNQRIRTRRENQKFFLNYLKISKYSQNPRKTAIIIILKENEYLHNWLKEYTIAIEVCIQIIL